METELEFTRTEDRPLFTGSMLRRLIIPLVIEQFLLMTVGMADTVMVTTVGESAVSGVSLVVNINTLLLQIFAALSTGGAISYVEVPNMENNLYAVLAMMKFIYDNIMYAELNTKSDYCQECGYDREIEIVEENGKLIWKCPNCGNTDQSKLNVARRTCGYIGTQFWNQGRTEEIRDRVEHL